MRQLALIALTFLWIAPVQAETKKAPDGFGPIKFGMTKEEAWAALDGEGEWKEDTFLVHRRDFPSGEIEPLSFRVSYIFRDDRVVAVNVGNAEENATNETCSRKVLYFVALISAIYGSEPVSKEDIHWAFAEPLVIKSSYYFFVFPKGASIYVSSVLYETQSSCNLNIFYRAAMLPELPF